jgi:hypothetical protein
MATEQHSSRTILAQADVIVRNGRIATQDDRDPMSASVQMPLEYGYLVLYVFVLAEQEALGIFHRPSHTLA